MQGEIQLSFLMLIGNKKTNSENHVHLLMVNKERQRLAPVTALCADTICHQDTSI